MHACALPTTHTPQYYYDNILFGGGGHNSLFIAEQDTSSPPPALIPDLVVCAVLWVPTVMDRNNIIKTNV